MAGDERAEAAADFTIERLDAATAERLLEPGEPGGSWTRGLGR